jgi:hypothetical protein
VFSGSIALEFLTPLLPKQFLLLACLSNIGKSVGVTTYVATHPAFMRSFATGENLADINAKGQVCISEMTLTNELKQLATLETSGLHIRKALEDVN